MGIQIRKALASDLDAVAAIYDRVHDAQDSGQLTTGWIRGVNPTRATAQAALDRGDLFVALLDGAAAGAAILNQVQVDVYAGAPWRYDVPDSDVMVLHTLVIDPAIRGRGAGPGLPGVLRGLRPVPWLLLPADRHQRPQCKCPGLLQKAGLLGGCRRPLHLQRHPRSRPGSAGKADRGGRLRPQNPTKTDPHPVCQTG